MTQASLRWLLAEMVREAERVIDHQVSELKELDTKSAHVTTTAQALLAGAVILITFVTGQTPDRVDAVFLAIFTLAATINAVSLTRSLDALSGVRAPETVSLGPSPAWLAERSVEGDRGIPEHLRAVLRGLSSYEKANVKVMRQKADKRILTLRLLSAAVALYTTSLFYILLEAGSYLMGGRPWQPRS